MLESLTVVVTCTDRKSTRPTPELTVRSLPNSSVTDRVGQWVDRIDSAAPSVRIRDLYRGDSWYQALRLEASAHRAAKKIRVLVASAGLGLRDIDGSAVPYSATFSAGNVDTVGTGAEQLSEWWRGLGASNAALSPDAALDGPTLLVLSSAYSRAMGPSLGMLRERDDVLTFGGDDSTDFGNRIPANKRLSSALGGTAMTLNLRSAIKWIDLSDTASIFSELSHIRWRAWAETASIPEAIERIRQSDDDIKDWIVRMIRDEPHLSRSAALRVFRQSGLACEQGRFAALFGSVRGA